MLKLTRILILFLISACVVARAQEVIRVPLTPEVRKSLRELKLSDKVLFVESYNAVKDYNAVESSDANKRKLLTLIQEYYVDRMSMDSREAKAVCEMTQMPLHHIERPMNESTVQLFSFVSYNELVQVVTNMTHNSNTQEYISNKSLYVEPQEVVDSYSQLLGASRENPSETSVVETPVVPVASVAETPVVPAVIPVVKTPVPKESDIEVLAQDVLEKGVFGEVIKYLDERQQKGELKYGSTTDMQESLSECVLVMVSRSGRQRVSAVLLPGQDKRTKYGTSETRGLNDFSHESFACICILLKKLLY